MYELMVQPPRQEALGLAHWLECKHLPERHQHQSPKARLGQWDLKTLIRQWYLQRQENPHHVIVRQKTLIAVKSKIVCDAFFQDILGQAVLGWMKLPLPLVASAWPSALVLDSRMR